MKRERLTSLMTHTQFEGQGASCMDSPGFVSDDTRLLRNIAQHRDSGALEELFKRYQKPAFSLAMRITMRRELAEEVLQEAMLVVWQSAESCQQMDKVRGWMLRIVALKSMRKCRDRSRERKRLAVRKDIELDIKQKATGDGVEQGEMIKALKKAYDGLTEDERHILTLNFGAGLTQVDISKDLGISSRAVSWRIQACLKKLRQRLAKAGISATMYTVADLESAICFDVDVPSDLGLKIGGMARDVCAKAEVVSPSTWLGWKLITGMVLTCVVGTFAALYDDFSAPKIDHSNNSQSITSDLKVVHPPVHSKWVFDKGPDESLDVILGEWSWKDTRKGFRAGMVADVGGGVYIRPRVSLPRRPLRVMIRARPILDHALNAGIIQDTVVGAVYELEGRMYEEKRRWRNRKHPIIMRGGKTYSIYAYFFDQYMVAFYEGGFIYSVMEHAHPYPDQKLVFMFKKMVVERIEADTITYDQIPARIRNPAELVRILIAEGKLTLDPPMGMVAPKEERK